MAIEQANAEALRARQDRIAEAEIEAIRNGRYAEVSSGEISLPIDNALQGLYKKFPGLKRDLIKSIRHSKFIPRMLFKLRYAQGVNTDRRTQEVLIKDGKIEVVAKDYLKDYGRTSRIWTEGFVNYAAILVEFFDAEFPGLHIALSRFMLDVIELEKIYDWQTAVLPLALQFHEELADDGLCSDPSRWTLDRQYVDRFCNATRLKSVHLNQPLADKVPRPSQRQHPLEPNDSSVICRKWNTPESCRWAGCRRRHAVDDRLADILSNLVFSSNMIENGGAGADVTLKLCRAIFRREEIPDDIGERDDEYTAIKQGLLRRNLPAGTQFVLRSRREIV
jgi:hypothetical protein